MAKQLRQASSQEMAKGRATNTAIPLQVTYAPSNIRFTRNPQPFADRRIMKARFHVLIASTAIAPLLACATPAEPKRELGDIQTQIQQVGIDVRKLAAERQIQLDQLKKLEKQYGELANTLLAIKGEIKQQEKSLQQVRDKVSATQKNIHSQRTGLEGLLKSAYATGNQESLTVFLNQRDPSLSGRMLVYHDYISKARVQKLQAIQDDLKTLRQLEAQKDTETQLLQVALDKKQQEIDAMQALKIQREKLLAEINRDYASKKDQLQDLIHDEKKLEGLLASLQKTDDNAPEEVSPLTDTSRNLKQQPHQSDQESLKTPEKFSGETRPAVAFADLRGQLPWPVRGPIIARFGSRRFETSWDGTVISAREGADIRAIAAGRVVFADWLRGYGLMLIVDHGNGYMSLYAFNQSLHKSVGEQVRSGEVLASVGRSGGRSDASLYFGIRKKGKPVDPEQWCKK